MKIKYILPVTLLSLASTYNAYGANTADADARSVNLEVSCDAGQNNCFDNLVDLNSWVETTRKPNSSTPLTVRVGSGTFLQPKGQNEITCDSQNFTGYVSFSGEGVNNSIIQLGNTDDFSAFFKVSGCKGMGFSNLTFRTDADYGYIVWSNGGSSTWNNVEVYGQGAAWKDGKCAAVEGEHYWYSSKLVSEQAFGAGEAYTARCDKTWLFGSEVTSIVPAGGDRYQGNSAGYNTAIFAMKTNVSNNEPEVHLYGSNIRAISHDTVANSPTYTRGTIYAGANGKIHIHGSGIDSISTNGEDIYILVAENGGFIHANESSYVIKTTGVVSRIDNVGSTIKAPYLWEQSTTAPSILSENGADMFVETDCNSAGICEGVASQDQRPHQMIYSSNCNTNGNWFDMATNACRQ